MTLPQWDFTLEQLVPLSDNAPPVVGLGKAMGLLGFGCQPRPIAVELLEFAHRILHIDEGPAQAELIIRQEVLYADSFAVPGDQFATGRIVRGQWHHPGA